MFSSSSTGSRQAFPKAVLAAAALWLAGPVAWATSPSAVDDVATTSEDTSVPISVLANDYDYDGDPVSLVSVTRTPRHGTATVSGSSVVYKPAPDYNGRDTFEYWIKDGNGHFDGAIVTVHVTPVADTPVAASDTVTTTEDQAVDFNVLANDRDPDNGQLALSAYTNPTRGTLVDYGAGAFTFTPTANVSGFDTFTYTVRNATGSATATVYLTILAANDAPVAVDDTVAAREDQASAVVISPATLLRNDTDVEGSPLTVELVDLPDPALATLTVLTTGSFSVALAADVNGAVTFTYRAFDGELYSDPATVTIQVTAVNDTPTVGTFLPVTVLRNGAPVSVTLTPPFADVDGTPPVLTFTVVGNTNPGLFADVSVVTTTTAKATATVLLLTPAAGAVGRAVLTVRATDAAGLFAEADLTVIVTSPDYDDTFEVAEDTATTLDVLTARGLTAADAVTVQSADLPLHGQLALDADRTAFVYTPDADFTGSDAFTFVVVDTQGQSEAYRVLIQVTPVNDPPVATGTAQVVVSEDAADTTLDLYNAFADPDDGAASLTFAVSANTDPDVVTATLEETPAHVLRLEYPADAWGSSEVTLTATDPDGASATLTITVVVLPVNDPPVAVADTANVTEDTATTIDVLANDSDPADDAPLTVAAFTAPAHGTVTLNADGSFTYTPTADYNGPDAFSYTLTDGSATVGPVAVTVTVVPVNDAPVAQTIATQIVDEDTVGAAIDLFAAVADPDDADAALTFTVTGNTNTALVTPTVTGNAGGRNLALVLADGVSGAALITVRATDTGGLTAITSFALVVLPVNDPPVAVDDDATTIANTTVTGDVLANDTDEEGDTLAVALIVTPPAHGTVVRNADGTLTYTPAAGYSGPDTFTYQATDGVGLSAAAEVRIQVGTVDLAPTTTGMADQTVAEDAADWSVNLFDAFADTEDADTALTFAVTANTNPGLVTATVTGTNPRRLTFHLAANASGSAQFTVRATDSAGQAADATFAVTVTPANDPPVAVADSATTAESTAVTVSVLANDTDPEGTTLALATFTQPANGTVAANPNGTLTYTPAANYNGTDTFTYQATDGLALSAATTVTVKVGSIDQPPTTTGIADLTVGEDAADQTVDLFAAFADAEDADTALTFTVTSNTNPALVTATVTGANPRLLSCHLTADAFGVAVLTVRALDSAGQSITTSFALTVRPANDAPVGVADSATTAEDTAVRITVLPNDTDAEGATLAVATFTPPASGTVVRNADGTLTYTPNAAFSGTDTFTYQATDGSALSAATTVTVKVGNIDQPPTTTGIADLTVDEDAADQTIDLFAAFADFEDADTALTFTVASNSNPALVTATVTGVSPRQLTLHLAANASGTAAITVRATDSASHSVAASFTLTVRPVNDAPVGVADSATTDEGTAVRIAVLPNDTDAEGATLAVATFTPPASGTVVRNADGTLTYTPNAAFSGTDTFTYQATDGQALSAATTVTVKVGNIDQPPTTTGIGNMTVDEDAADQTIDLFAAFADSEDADTALTFTMASNSNPALVTATITGVSPRQLTLHLTASASGTAAIAVRATDSAGHSVDAAFTLTVRPVNDAPVGVADSATTAENTAVRIAVLPNDTDAEGTTLAVATFTPPASGTVVRNADGTLTYTPNAAFSGTDTFTYQATDGSALSAATTVTAKVGNVDQPPTTTGIADLTVVEDAADQTIDLFAAFADFEDADTALTFTVASNSNPALATATVTGVSPRQLTLHLAANASGTARITVRATDSLGQATDAAFTLTVNATNDAPVAVADAVQTPEDTALTFAPAANDTDVDSTSLRLARVTATPTHGRLGTNANGTVLYTPDANWSGADSFAYIVTDGLLESAAPATVTITVTAVNDRPTTSGLPAVAARLNSPAVALDLFPAFADVEDADSALTFSVTANSNPALVTASITGTAAGRQVTLTFAAGASGSATVTVRAADTGGSSVDASFTVTVSPANRPPTAVADSATTPEDTAVRIAALGNDTDPDGDALSVASFTNPTNGALAVNADGSFSYTPTANVSGADSFTYTVTDGRAESAAVTVTLTVTPANDAPVTTGLADVSTTAGAADTLVDLFPAFSDTEDSDAALTFAVTGNTNSALFATSPAIEGVPLRWLRLHLAAGANGTAVLTVRATDTGGLSVSTNFTVTVTAVNHAPVATADTATTPEDAEVEIAVLANDTDSDNDTLTVAGFTPPTNGTATIARDPDTNLATSVTYQPHPGFAGTDHFTYTVTDGQDAWRTAAVTVTVTQPANRAPVAVQDTYTLDASGGNTTLTVALPTGTVLGNDSDPDGDSLTAILDPDEPTAGVDPTPELAHGTLSFYASGAFTYTLTDLGFRGVDRFDYAVTDGTAQSGIAFVYINVADSNAAPVAADDAYTTGMEDTPLRIVAPGIVGNDTDADGDTLMARPGSTPPAHGTLTPGLDPQGNGAFLYTPDPGYVGTDTFTYAVSDGVNTSAEATVTVTVSPVGQAPTVAAAIADMTPAEDAAIADTDLYTVFDDADNADAELVFAVTGNTNPGLFQTAAVSGAPVAHLLSLVLAPDASGVAVLTVRATDPTGRYAEDTFTVTVSPANDAPVAAADAVSTPEDTPVTITVLANDTDVDGDTLSVTALTAPASGAAVANADGTVTYTPAANVSGIVTFTYKADDGTAQSTAATVTVTVTAVADAPTTTGIADPAPVAEDAAAFSVNLAASFADVDPEDGDLQYSVAGVADAGLVSLTVDNAANLLWITPRSNAYGPSTITIKATDHAGLYARSTFTVTVTPANDAPTAADDSAVTSAGQPVSISVLANDRDIDSSGLSVVLGPAPANGAAVVGLGGAVTYTPNAGFAGIDTFTYQASDGAASSGVATVTVTVTASPAANVAPVAAADAATTAEDTAVTIVVLANDTDADGDSLAVAVVTQPAHGTAATNANGTVTYAPSANWNGIDTFTYEATDGVALSAAATVTVTVTAASDAPVAVADTATTAVNTAATIAVLANDTDADAGTTLFVSSLTQPAHGTVVRKADDTVEYTPAAGFAGTDTFTYRASDGTLLSAPATVTVAVSATNGAPVVTADTATTAEDTPVVVAVLANDTDPNGDAVVVALVTQPTNGMVSANANGTVTYAPSANWNGIDTFTYEASDGAALSAAATVTVTVTAASDAPVAVADTATTAVNTAATIAVLANDTDADAGTTLLVSTLTQPAHGTAVRKADDTVEYTPVTGFTGTDTFTYRASDGTSLSAPATVTVTVTALPANVAPVTAADAATTAEDTAVTIAVLANDTDADGDGLAVAVVTQPAHGTAATNANGTVTYAPSANWNGIDTFTYEATDGAALSAAATVTVTVTAASDAPVAVADTATTAVNTAATIAVLANDTDADAGTTLFVSSLTQPAHGTVVRKADDTVEYTPATGFSGTDTFTYRAADGVLLSAPATVTVAVSATNGAPVVTADTATTAEDTPVVVAVLANDTDPNGDAVVVALVTQPTNGVVWANGDGTVTYTPNANWNGVDTFTYEASDGTTLAAPATVTVTVTAVNDPPVAVADTADTAIDTSTVIAVLANDTDADAGTTLLVSALTQPAHGTAVRKADDTVEYTPATDFSGTDTFTYRASDGTALSAAATVTVTVALPPANTAPATVADTATTAEDTPVTLDLLANDTDADGDAVAVAVVTQPANGTVVSNADGTVTYTPNANWNGADTFTYEVTDGTALSAAGTVTVTVTAVNDAPAAVADEATAAANATTAIAVLANDTDVDTGTSLLVSTLSQPANGTVVRMPDETVEYTPAASFTGVDTFTYCASDGTALSAPATVTVTVVATAPNSVPVAADDTATTPEGTAVTITPLTNDTDADGTAVALAVVGRPTDGVVLSAGNGALVYVPIGDFNGTDSFTYRVTDGVSLSTPATVTVTVTPVNDAPVAQADTATATGGTPLVIDVTANDTDVDGDVLVAVVASQPASGTVAGNGNGTVTFTPAAGYAGTVTFTYRASDGAALSAAATVTVTVTAANTAPTTSGLADLTVEEDTADSLQSVDLFAAFADVETADEDLVLAVVGNTDPTLFIDLWIEDGTLWLALASDASGASDLTVRATDTAGASVQTTFTVTVTPVDDTPVAGDDFAAVDPDTFAPVDIDVLATDSDAEGPLDVASVTVTSAPIAGTVAVNPDGSLTYTPGASFTGVDALRYTVADGAGQASNEATVVVALLNWTFRIAVTNAQPAVLTLGMDATATDAVDPGLDIPALLPPPIGGQTSGNACLVAADGTALAQDLHALGASGGWVLKVEAPADAACVLSWDSTARQAASLYLLQVDEFGNPVLPAAAATRDGVISQSMSATASATVPAGTTVYLAVIYGVYAFDMTLVDGWNLISVPLLPLDPSAATVLGDAIVGEPWTWAGSQYEKSGRILPFSGYWVLHSGGDVTVKVWGTLLLGTPATLSQGWNLVGPVGAPPFAAVPLPLVTDPADAVYGPIWVYGNGYYSQATQLEAGQGCWINATRACAVWLSR